MSPVDLVAYDGPRYYVVPVDQRPPCPAEPAPHDLDVIRTDVEPGSISDGVQRVWTPVRAGQAIPARLAHLPRRACDHAGGEHRAAGTCPRFHRLGDALVSVNYPGVEPSVVEVDL